MCIIIRNTTGKPVPKKIARKCVTINADGFGVVYLDGKGDHHKTLDMKHAERVLTTETRPYIAHCRYATVGEVCSDGIHPFPLGKGRYLFQNGTVDVKDSTVCDTAQLARSLFGLSDTRIHFILTALSGCRFATCSGKDENDGELFGKWHKKDGIEYSKNNVLPAKKWKSSKGYSGGYTGGNRHHESQYGYYGGGRWNSYSETSKGDADPTNEGPDVAGWSEIVEDGLSYYVRDEEPTPEKTNGSTHLVAVYGTLKQGRGNHKVMASAGGAYVGDGRTAAKYRLCINGLPYLIAGSHHRGHQVNVEAYEVDSAGLHLIDSLEGHPDFYKRETIRIQLDGEVGTRKAYVYFVDSSYDSGAYVDKF